MTAKLGTTLTKLNRLWSKPGLSWSTSLQWRNSITHVPCNWTCNCAPSKQKYDHRTSRSTIREVWSAHSACTADDSGGSHPAFRNALPWLFASSAWLPQKAMASRPTRPPPTVAPCRGNGARPARFSLADAPRIPIRRRRDRRPIWDSPPRSTTLVLTSPSALLRWRTPRRPGATNRLVATSE